MKVQLLAYTPEPEKIIAAAAKLCYSQASATNLFEGLTDAATTRFVKMLSGLGHASPLEHASFTFAVDGVSRACLAQLTRHRIASYSVQSQRYVGMENAQFVIPPDVDADPEAREIFLAAVENDIWEYNDVKRNLFERHKRTLIAEKHMSEDLAAKQAEKMANEDARFVLPNACATNLVMTMNARSLMNFFSLRCCNRAQWEIRQLATEMYRLVYGLAPNVFASAGPSCVVCGRCSEGSMSCGKKAEMQELFASLRQEEQV